MPQKVGPMPTFVSDDLAPRYKAPKTKQQRLVTATGGGPPRVKAPPKESGSRSGFDSGETTKTSIHNSEAAKIPYKMTRVAENSKSRTIGLMLI